MEYVLSQYLLTCNHKYYLIKYTGEEEYPSPVYFRIYRYGTDIELIAASRSSSKVDPLINGDDSV